MEKEKHPMLEEKDAGNNSKDDEDLLYTHKSESRDSSLRWNSAFCRKPGR